jgi:4-diphosphocytidyl-2C-methyl-D-erythritol kinase
MRMATLHELSTVYSLKDCYDMIEIAAVDAHNRRVLNPPKTS